MKVALIGNQNSGKTSLFNILTGTNQKVGNWPGVTIERKEGKIKDTDITIVDLPGIYSLSPYTAEEEVSRRYILEEKPDVVINIVDATSIERSLYLTTQLLELDTKVIIALNMADMLEKKQIQIDEQKLSELLHTSIVRISALKQTGIDELIHLITSKSILENNHQKIYAPSVEDILDYIMRHRGCNRFEAVKIFEKEERYLCYVTDSILYRIDQIEKSYQYDTEQIIANERYNFITDIKNQCVTQPKNVVTITDQLDKILLNKWLAIPIFACIMALIYYLAVGVVGSWTVDLVDGVIHSFSGWVSETLSHLGASSWIISLICDGIIKGVGAVLNFAPQLVILFLCIAILETSGYMSRIAFFLDKVFKKFGLSGKSLIPFIVGSGCSVPGIMTARTVEDEDERAITIVCTPFIPCSAKLPIIAMFAGAFFDQYSGLITVSLYFLAIVIILISAVILKKFFFKGNPSSFISELPEYKLPSIKYVIRDVGEKVIAFIKRAGTVILICSIAVWFLLSFNWKLQYGVNVEDSILASIGNVFAWVFYPMLGEWSWGATVSAIQGLVAKEQVVSSMNIIAGLAEESQDITALFGSGVFGFFNPASAYAFCMFNLFSAPCFGAIGAMRRELGSTKRMFQAILFQTGLAWILGCLAFGIGSLILHLI
ncbi:MAG: ferrous iron transport protein B [Prevotella sp.]|nr:ferrous iron transport protein B [Staphylococcus sp.]MCM1350008.1 ferrous iron transport protein B [Prevotella sp.]